MAITLPASIGAAGATCTITDHWLQLAQRHPSPFCNQRPRDTTIDLLVIHAISLPEGCYGQDHVRQLFTGTLDPCGECAAVAAMEVSAHLFIQRDGGVIQFVPFCDRAWHAGQSSYRGRENCNDYSIGIELEGTDHTPFDSIQYSRLAQITAALVLHYPAMKHAVGHSDIATPPGRKADPGPCFDWSHYRDTLHQLTATTHSPS